MRAVNALGNSDAVGPANATPSDGRPTLPAGHTELLRATLTVQDLGSSVLGCRNTTPGSQCSTTSVLSDDDFSYGGSLAVAALTLRGAGRVDLVFSSVIASALTTEVGNGFTLHLGDEALAFSSGTLSTSGTQSTVIWTTSDVSWMSSDEIHILLETSARAPDAPTKPHRGGG